MKVFPVAILVLLAFAAFFMTFLVAPLAVLTIFYIVYSVRARSGSEPAKAPATDETQRPWDSGEPSEDETAGEPAPARRGRITVESHRERDAAAAEAAAAERDAAEQDAAPDGEPPADGSQTATATKHEP